MENTNHPPEAFKYLRGRTIVPLHHEPRGARGGRPVEDSSLPEVSNIQGDVIYLFPKKAENFIFFRIHDSGKFKTALKAFEPTSSDDVADNLARISEAKEKAYRNNTSTDTIELEQYQIAFTRMGLNLLGVNENTGDVRFDHRAMRDDKGFLGDLSDWDPIFNKTNFDEVNGSVADDAGALHGVITVAGSSPEACTKASLGVKALFGPSIRVSGVVEGRARPDQYKGHEHFGYKDGVSQPAIRGLVSTHPGQIQVDPGVIIMGYKGDPVMERPPWTKDGTMLVFRKLEQDVIPFENYLTQNGPYWRDFIPGGPDSASPPLTDAEGAELFGARLIGRWKSGAPLARCPFRDDPKVATNPTKNNNFDYVVPGKNEPSDFYCPFTIHTRKTAPRNLDPFIDRKFLESGSIVRAGLPYGKEVTDQERQDVADGKPGLKRGLLFTCYMSSLDSGFIRQQVGYANNDFFPITSLVPRKHGQDPIIGGPSAESLTPLLNGNQVQLNLRLGGATGTRLEATGVVNITTSNAMSEQPFFVTSRGGEYFFVPSISTLKDWAGSPS